MHTQDSWNNQWRTLGKPSICPTFSLVAHILRRLRKYKIIIQFWVLLLKVTNSKRTHALIMHACMHAHSKGAPAQFNNVKPPQTTTLCYPHRATCGVGFQKRTSWYGSIKTKSTMLLDITPASAHWSMTWHIKTMPKLCQNTFCPWHCILIHKAMPETWVAS